MPPHSWGPLSPCGMKFCHEILETLCYHLVKTRSLSQLALKWYQVVTDIITVANTAIAWRIKMVIFFILAVLFIVTSTGDLLFSSINIDDLE